LFSNLILLVYDICVQHPLPPSMYLVPLGPGPCSPSPHPGGEGNIHAVYAVEDRGEAEKKR